MIKLNYNVHIFSANQPNINFLVTIQGLIIAIFVITRIEYCERYTIEALLLQIIQSSKTHFFSIKNYEIIA